MIQCTMLSKTHFVRTENNSVLMMSLSIGWYSLQTLFTPWSDKRTPIFSYHSGVLITPNWPLKRDYFVEPGRVFLLSSPLGMDYSRIRIKQWFNFHWWKRTQCWYYQYRRNFLAISPDHYGSMRFINWNITHPNISLYHIFITFVCLPEVSQAVPNHPFTSTSTCVLESVYLTTGTLGESIQLVGQNSQLE